MIQCTCTVIMINFSCAYEYGNHLFKFSQWILSIICLDFKDIKQKDRV